MLMRSMQMISYFVSFPYTVFESCTNHIVFSTFANKANIWLFGSKMDDASAPQT